MLRLVVRPSCTPQLQVTDRTMSAPKKALVTGATGLLGRAVVKVFETSGGWSVMGIGFSRASPPRTLKCDLTNREAVEKVVSDVK